MKSSGTSQNSVTNNSAAVVNNVPSSHGVPQIILEVNRLSGPLPSSFQDTYGINVLNGNVFQCGSGRSNKLPTHDPSSGTYICGADEFNQAMISVAVSVSLLILCGLAVLMLSGRYRSKLKKFPSAKKAFYLIRKEVYSLQELIFSITTSLHRAPYFTAGFMEKYNHLVHFFDSMTTFRDINNWVALFSLCVCLPTYCLFYLLTDKFSTHQQQYSWVTTSVFLTGDAPAAVFCVLWTTACLITCVLIVTKFRLTSANFGFLSVWSRKMSWLFQPVSSVRHPLLPGETPEEIERPSDFSSRAATIDPRDLLSANKKKSVARLFYIAFIFTLNGAIAITLNSGYVYILSSNSVTSSLKILCQVFMAGIKLLLNMVLVKKLVMQIPFGKARAKLHVLMLLFNSLVAPCLATSLNDSSCFKELFTGSGTICSSYSFRACLEASQEMNGNGQYVTVCSLCTESSFVFEFSPAFTYNYSCGSAILMAYIPVFVYTYLILAIGAPILYFILATIPVKYIPLSILNGIDGVLRPQDFALSHDRFDLQRATHRFIQAESIQALFIQHIAILLTFGMNSPLLAVTIAFTQLVHTYMWQYIMFRYINVSQKHSNLLTSNLRDSLEADSVVEETSDNEIALMLQQSESLSSTSNLYFRCKDEDESVGGNTTILTNVDEESKNGEYHEDGQGKQEDDKKEEGKEEEEGDEEGEEDSLYHVYSKGDGGYMSSVASIYEGGQLNPLHLLEGNNRLLMVLNASCGNSWCSLKHCMWLLLYCSCIFYGFILFDIVGDSHGITTALFVPAALLVVVIAIRILLVDIVAIVFG